MRIENEVRRQKDQKPRMELLRNKRVVFLIAMFAAMMVLSAMPVFAATGTVNAPATMGKLISLMCSMFKYVGIALFVWAIIQFILATKRSDADSKADAIQTAVCGVALIGIGVIIDNLEIANLEDVDDTVLDNN